jgi:chromosome segregation ATPase
MLFAHTARSARTLAAAMGRAEQLFSTINALRAVSGSDHGPEIWETAIQSVHAAAMEVELCRQASECTNGAALRTINAKIITKLVTIEEMLADLKATATNSTDPHSDDLDQAASQLELANSVRRRDEMLKLEREARARGEDEIKVLRDEIAKLKRNENVSEQELQDKYRELTKEMHDEAVIYRNEISMLNKRVLQLQHELNESNGMLDASKQANQILSSEILQLKKQLVQVQRDAQSEKMKMQVDKNQGVIMAHELKSLHTKVAQVEKELRQRDSEYHALLETHQVRERQMHK